jgi:hypothetical protein
MNPELTEEEMRRALFGNAEPESPVAAAPTLEPITEVFVKPALPAARKKFRRRLLPGCE